MKEASGELSMTAVAVVAIAAVGVLFTTLIWPNIKQGILQSTKCSQAFDCKCGTDTGNSAGAGKCICSYYLGENETGYTPGGSATGTVVCDDKDS